MIDRTLFAVLVLGLLEPHAAHAESRPTLLADHLPGSPDGALELELGWFTNSKLGTLHVFAPVVSGRYAVSESAELELDWPFGFVDISSVGGRGDSGFQSGNPFPAAYYMQRRGDGYFRVGAGVALPLANVDITNSSTADLFALALPAAIRGLWDVWLYLPDRISLVVPLQVESRSGKLVLGGDFAGAVLISTDSAVSDQTEIALQAAGLIGAKTGSATIGTRLQFVWEPTSDGDNVQLALVPFVQADFSDGGFFYGRFLINLDEPLGILGNGGDVWGLFLGGGARL